MVKCNVQAWGTIHCPAFDILFIDRRPEKKIEICGAIHLSNSHGQSPEEFMHYPRRRRQRRRRRWRWRRRLHLRLSFVMAYIFQII